MLSSSPSAAAGMMGGGGGGGYQHHHQRGAAVFTAAQWAELEQQALIYKYLMAGVPVPGDLLLPIRPHSAAAATYSFANPAAAPFYHHHHPSLSYYAYYGKKLDPEPWRCRRTDGKKWRCSKEAHPDSKYCERHMHRGRNRSRKPVESKTAAPAPQSQPQQSNVAATATHDADAPLPSLAVGAKTHGLSLGGAGSSQFHVDASSYGSKYSLGAKADVGELSFFSGASGNTRGFTIDSPTDNPWHSLPSSVPPYPMSKPRDSGLLPGRRDSWSEMDEERSNQTSFSTTQLSISIPMPRCD
ncbi:growth-regulating factor 5 isoform X2 [Oryza brachyantha]|uniref:growth-regulating factor 5 isoform X2 n=1 Tax=Oryza brachyantha TaxID=4533 RepID=UPI001ADBA371|nr:growth-regulating factor 5 isoform X2 [Oryza brachyantha]